MLLARIQCAKPKKKTRNQFSNSAMKFTMFQKFPNINFGNCSANLNENFQLYRLMDDQLFLFQLIIRFFRVMQHFRLIKITRRKRLDKPIYSLFPFRGCCLVLGCFLGCSNGSVHITISIYCRSTRADENICRSVKFVGWQQCHE